MTGRDFLTLASCLVAGADEASWRTAVSRAYYAAFHVARQLMNDLGFTVPYADRAHGYLWLRLQNSGEPSVVQAGADLKDLRGLRNKADYDLSFSLRSPFARTQYSTAESIILALEAAAVEPIRSQIVAGMRAYEVAIGQVSWRP